MVVPLEVSVLLSVNDVEGVVALLDYYELPDSFVLVMERPDSSEDMFDYITRKGAIEENVARGFFKQIVEIVLACHGKGAVHRDIRMRIFLSILKQEN